MTTSAVGVQGGRSESALTVESARASSRTRAPVPDQVEVSTAGSMTSGAPITHQAPSTTAADHLRAEEKGTQTSGRVPCGKRAASASIVGLGFSSAAASVARTCSGTGGFSATISRTLIPGAVSVPVLSTQTTSTRARVSTAGMSCTRAWRWASRTTPTAIAMLVSSTRPSGIIVTTPAIAPRIASSRVWSACSWLQVNSAPIGMMARPMYRMKRLIESRSSEVVVWNFRACAVSRPAKESAPTRVTRYDAEPETTNDPDMRSSPADLSTGSASPVSRLSSTSNPSVDNTSPSTGIWSPVETSTRSSTTSSRSPTSVVRPLRTTVGRASLSSESFARVRALRYSWTVPISVLNTMTSPNRASCQGATRIMTIHRVPMRPLNHVRVLLRRMLARLRLPVSRTSLT